MKIITLMGSPKRKGNTATVLGWFEQLVAPAHQVERVNIVDLDIRGCTGCHACQKVMDRPGCVQKDDAPALIERLLAADAVVYATPLYCWDFTAQMKALIDRHFCLSKWQGSRVARALLSGKRMALLVTCADPVENNADLIQVMFDRIVAVAGGVMVGKYMVPDCSTPDKLGEAARAVAAQMARDLAVCS